jgi:quinol monooxygenase YgiN
MELSRRVMVAVSVGALAAKALGQRGASAEPATPAAGASSFTITLLTIRGTLAPATQEDARQLHNKTAGDPASIAAARSLGDISHMVYAPLAPATAGAGDILFMDLWTSTDGLSQFFANPQVQAQAAQIFSERDPVVWDPASDFLSYHLPAPYGQNDRFVALARGTVRSREEALAAHNTIVASQLNNARMAGTLSHEPYFRAAAPGEPETLEFLSVDVWMNASTMQQFYADPDFQAALATLFVAAPDVSAWTSPAGSWTEW